MWAEYYVGEAASDWTTALAALDKLEQLNDADTLRSARQKRARETVRASPALRKPARRAHLDAST